MLSRSTLFGTIFAFALTSCGGGGGGDEDAGADASITDDNLTALKVELLSNDPNAGHQVSLKTTIRANRNFDNVPVLYILVSKADLEADREEIKVLYFEEEYVIPQVTAGESEHNITAIIPLEVEGESEWYLTPVIDPQGDIEESDEEDNLLTADTVLLLNISNANTGRPDVAVQDVLFDDSMVLDVNADDNSVLYNPVSYEDPFSGDITLIDEYLANFDFGASLELALTGSEQQVVGVYADLIMYRDEIDAITKEILFTYEDTVYPLLTWDWSPVDFLTGEELPPEYNYYLEQTIFPGEENFVDLEILIPGANHDDVELVLEDDYNSDGIIGSSFNLRKYIESSLLNVQQYNATQQANNATSRQSISFYVRISIDKVNFGGTLDEYEGGYIDDPDIVGEADQFEVDDSEIWLPLAIFTDDADPAVDASGIPVPLPPVGQTGECRDLEYEKNIDKKWGGKLFGLSLAFDNKASVTKTEGATSELNASVPLNVFGFSTNMVDFKSEAMLLPTAGSVENDSSIRQTLTVLDKIVFSSVTIAQANVPFARGMKSYSQEKKFSLIGGVVLSGSATMGYGLEVDASIDNTQLKLGVGPFAEISGSVGLGADLGLFKGSIEGQLVLLKNSIQAEADAQLGIQSDNKIRGTLTASLVNKLAGPSGSIDAVGSVNGCLGADSVINTAASVGSCAVSAVSSLISGIGDALGFRPNVSGRSSVNGSRLAFSCHVSPVSCPQAEVFRTSLESFEPVVEKSTPILSVKAAEFGLCL